MFLVEETKDDNVAFIVRQWQGAIGPKILTPSNAQVGVGRKLRGDINEDFWEVTLEPFKFLH